MIAGIFHKGSGLGNQLFRYVFTRTLALDKGVMWGMNNPELFKGSQFMSIDMGLPVRGIEFEYQEKRLNHPNGDDIRTYDWENILHIKNNTVVDGEFQGEDYFNHRINEVREWLKVEPLDMPDDLCVIGFRGGEYVGLPQLFLTKDYWDDAIKMMREINPHMRFEVHTDDPRTASTFFDFPIIHDIGINWRSVRYAKYLIIANSSFYILPTLLNQDVKKVIAPKFWARRNLGFWALPYNEYKGWQYI